MAVTDVVLDGPVEGAGGGVTKAEFERESTGMIGLGVG
jgi:hypothetical protein